MLNFNLSVKYLPVAERCMSEMIHFLQGVPPTHQLRLNPHDILVFTKLHNLSEKDHRLLFIYHFGRFVPTHLDRSRASSLVFLTLKNHFIILHHVSSRRISYHCAHLSLPGHCRSHRLLLEPDYRIYSVPVVK